MNEEAARKWFLKGVMLTGEGFNWEYPGGTMANSQSVFDFEFEKEWTKKDLEAVEPEAGKSVVYWHDISSGDKAGVIRESVIVDTDEISTYNGSYTVYIMDTGDRVSGNRILGKR